MPRSLSDRLVYSYDRVRFVDQVLTENYFSQFVFEFVEEPRKRWPTGDALKTFCNEIQFVTIVKKTEPFQNISTFPRYIGAIVTVNGNKYLVFRNGNNISGCNMAMVDYQTTKMHFRTNQTQIINLVKVLSADMTGLLLLIHQKLDPSTHQILLERIS